MTKRALLTTAIACVVALMALPPAIAQDFPPKKAVLRGDGSVFFNPNAVFQLAKSRN